MLPKKYAFLLVCVLNACSESQETASNSNSIPDLNNASANKARVVEDSQFVLTMNNTKTDWTPLLKSFENGCEFDEPLGKFIGSLSGDTSSDDPMAPYNIGTVELSQPYLATVGTPNRLITDSETELQITMLDSTYYDIPLRKLGFYRGHSSGILGVKLYLGTTYAEASEKLQHVEYRTIQHEETEPTKAKIVDENGFTVLLCDVSI